MVLIKLFNTCTEFFLGLEQVIPLRCLVLLNLVISSVVGLILMFFEVLQLVKDLLMLLQFIFAFSQLPVMRLEFIIMFFHFLAVQAVECSMLFVQLFSGFIDFLIKLRGGVRQLLALLPQSANIVFIVARPLLRLRLVH